VRTTAYSLSLVIYTVNVLGSNPGNVAVSHSLYFFELRKTWKKSLKRCAAVIGAGGGGVTTLPVTEIL
jgi:hypothetical protein